MSERFGPFELSERLGECGIAETRVATRRGPGGFEQWVCVKRVRPAWGKDPRIVRMFLEEARIVGRLRHATLVNVIEAGTIEGVPYLAFEFIEGSDLRSLIASARARGALLGPEALLLIALDLATALEVVHRAGIVHRDVTPGNVLVSVSGEVKLGNFAIAKAADAARSPATGLWTGNLPYVAPEYAETGQATPRSDLYALGVTLFEVATGERPYATESALALIEHARAGRRPPLGALAPDLPGVLAAAIEQLLEPDPRVRLSSASELFDVLANLVPSPGARRRLGHAVRTLAPCRAGPPTVPAPSSSEAPTRRLRALRAGVPARPEA